MSGTRRTLCGAAGWWVALGLTLSSPAGAAPPARCPDLGALDAAAAAAFDADAFSEAAASYIESHRELKDHIRAAPDGAPGCWSQLTVALRQALDMYRLVDQPSHELRCAISVATRAFVTSPLAGTDRLATEIAAVQQSLGPELHADCPEPGAADELAYQRPTSPRPDPPEDPSPRPPPPPPRTLRKAGWSTLGAGGAALAALGVTLSLAGRGRQDLADACTPLCSTSDADVRSAQQSIHATQAASIAVGVVGGALLITGAALLGADRRRFTRSSFTPTLKRHYVGLGWEMRF